MAVRNLVFNMAYQVVNTVANIILPPLIVGAYGSVLNGLVGTIKTIMNYIQTVGSGISEASVVSLYRPLGEKDEKKISSIYNAVGKSFNRAGALFSFISVAVAFVYPFFVTDDVDYFTVVKLVLILSVSGMSEFFFAGKFRTLLTADQRLYVVNVAQTLGAAASAILAFFLIKKGWGIEAVQGATVVAYVCRIAVMYVFVRRNYAYLDKKAEPDLAATSRRGAATVHQIAGLVINGGQVLVVSTFCGLAEGSVFTVYSMIFSGLSTILSTVSSAMLAGMGNLISSGDEERVRRIFRLYELGYDMAAFTVYVVALIMIKPFISIYTAGMTDANYMRPELIMLFVCIGLVSCARTPGTTMICARGHYKETAWRAVAEAVICVVSQLVFVNLLGTVGVLVGSAVAYLYRTADIIFYTNHRLLAQSAAGTFKRFALFVPLVAVAALVSSRVSFSTSGYFSWAAVAVVVSLVAFLAVFAIAAIFDRKTLRDGMGYALSLIKRS